MATIVAIGLLTLTTTATNVQASGFKDLGRDLGNALEDLGNGIDDASANYKQGYADGERAGVRGGSSECQSSDGVYCVGYNTGYGVGQRSSNVVNQNSDDNDDDNDNGNSNSGTNEDDGKRHIEKSS